jgi:hypothetical protein
MIRLEIKPSLVWKRLGVAEPPADAGARADFDDAYRRGCDALEPRFATRRRRVTGVSGGEVEVEGGYAFVSRDLARLTAGAESLAFMAATVGESLDDLTDEYNGRGEVFKMSVADAVGSVAAEELISRVHAGVKASAAAAGLTTSRRISPGYGDFGLEHQRRLLRLLGAGALGISLTEHFMMIPRKSVTAVAALSRV